MSKQENQRWWEFYAVRYGIGTVTGGIIFFFLCSLDPQLRPMLFGAAQVCENSGGKCVAGVLSTPVLILLAGYGLAFSYIASAPILVFHTARFMFQFKRSGKSDYFWITFIAIFVPIFIAAMYHCNNRTDHSLLLLLLTSLASLVMIPQYSMVIFAGFQSKKLYAFYKRLDSKRANYKGSLVDSYKHLREHGNAFAIVVFNMLLATLLFMTGRFSMKSHTFSLNETVPPQFYFFAILVWILPAAFVWVIGMLLERHFMEDESDSSNKETPVRKSRLITKTKVIFNQE